MRGSVAHRALPLALVILALAAAAGLTTLKHSITLTAGTSAPPPAAAAVSAVTRACPAPGLAGMPTARVAVIAAGGSSGAPAGQGSAVVSRLGVTSGSSLVSLRQPGSLTVTKVKAPKLKAPPARAKPSPTPTGQPVATVPVAGGVVVQASGPMSRGLEAEQVQGLGNAVSRCDSPGTDFWFVAPGRFTVASIQLYLMNPGSQPADVNVEALTDAGPLQGNTDTGVAVAPHSMVVQSLASLLHGSRVVALHVRTSVGQVAAALHESTNATHGGTWVPAAQPPATQVVVPGLPDVAGTRQLFVAVPGTADAHITLTAVTSRGSYEPTGGSGLDIPGGSAVAIALPSLGGVPGALKLVSNVPVTASALVPGGQPGAPGVFSAACPAIEEQGVVAESQSGPRKSSELVLSAPLHAVSARIQEIGPGGGQPQAAGAGKVVQIAAKRSVVVQLSPPPGAPKGAAFAVVITPLAGSGPLYAGRALMGAGKGGALQSIVPVASALTTVRLPTVRDAPITPRP